MQAKIYQPTKTAMQSGMGNTYKWVLEYNSTEGKRFIEGVMGWTASSDMHQQIKMSFDNKENAVEYARKNNIEFEIIEPHHRKVTKKSYADNFK